MTAGLHDRVMFGIEGLDDDLTRNISPAASAGNLCEELKCPLCGPEIGEVQGHIRGNDADQVDVGEIMALGDHLSSHEDIDFPVFQAPEDPFTLPPSGYRVPVHASDGGMGKMPPDLGLQSLRSGAVPEYAPSSAGGADGVHFFTVVAIVAVQPAGIAVIGQGDRAMGTGEPMPAIGAVEKSVKSPPVKKQEGLVSLGQTVGHGMDQGRGKNGDGPRFVFFVAHGDDFHLRQGPVFNPVGKGKTGIFPRADVVIGLQPRRGGAQNNRGAGHLPPDDGGVPSVVPGPLVLLVRSVVLLIDDDEPQVPQRSENGRACPDGDL